MEGLFWAMFAYLSTLYYGGQLNKSKKQSDKDETYYSNPNCPIPNIDIKTDTLRIHTVIRSYKEKSDSYECIYKVSDGTFTTLITINVGVEHKYDNKKLSKLIEYLTDSFYIRKKHELGV